MKLYIFLEIAHATDSQKESALALDGAVGHRQRRDGTFEVIFENSENLTQDELPDGMILHAIYPSMYPMFHMN